MINFFPEGKSYGQVFRRALYPMTLFCTPIALICGGFAAFGYEAVWVGDIPIKGVWGLVLSLAILPFGIASSALIVAFYSYFGRKIPGVRFFLPRARGEESVEQKDIAT